MTQFSAIDVTNGQARRARWLTLFLMFEILLPYIELVQSRAMFYASTKNSILPLQGARTTASACGRQWGLRPRFSVFGKFKTGNNQLNKGRKHVCLTRKLIVRT